MQRENAKRSSGPKTADARLDDVARAAIEAGLFGWMSERMATAVDDRVGIILDVAVTTGQPNEGEMLEPQVMRFKQ